MPRRKPTSLPEWDNFAVAEGSAVIDTLWAPSSFLTVIKVRQMTDKVRRHVAYVGHFSLLKPGVLHDYLRQAKTALGTDVDVMVRGGSILVKEDDPADLRETMRRDQAGDRRRFLQILRDHGYPAESLDLAWAADCEATKILYYARSGMAQVLTRPVAGILDELDDVPDVLR